MAPNIWKYLIFGSSKLSFGTISLHSILFKISCGVFLSAKISSKLTAFLLRSTKWPGFETGPDLSIPIPLSYYGRNKMAGPVFVARFWQIKYKLYNNNREGFDHFIPTTVPRPVVNINDPMGSYCFNSETLRDIRRSLRAPILYSLYHISYNLYKTKRQKCKKAHI